MKTMEKAFVLAFLVTVLLSFTGLAGASEDIPNHILRLHVLANSDTSEDQELKLSVRDRILAESEGIFFGVHTKEEAEDAVTEHIGCLEAAAHDEIQKHGYSYPVEIGLENTYFPTRQYGEITLPAGRYDALRVKIGKAEGHNWWCVMFPSLCVPAAGDGTELEDVLSASQMDLVEGGYEIKFKTVELYEQAKEWIAGHF